MRHLGGAWIVLLARNPEQKYYVYIHLGAINIQMVAEVMLCVRPASSQAYSERWTGLRAVCSEG